LEKNLPPEMRNGDGDGEIFPIWGGSGEPFPTGKIPRCHIYSRRVLPIVIT
jgi:hypothetical protein